jgi:hypothetical protein
LSFKILNTDTKSGRCTARVERDLTAGRVADNVPRRRRVRGLSGNTSGDVGLEV